jgi:hypothetical protein
MGPWLEKLVMRFRCGTTFGMRVSGCDYVSCVFHVSESSKQLLNIVTVSCKQNEVRHC